MSSPPRAHPLILWHAKVCLRSWTLGPFPLPPCDIPASQSACLKRRYTPSVVIGAPSGSDQKRPWDGYWGWAAHAASENARIRSAMAGCTGTSLSLPFFAWRSVRMPASRSTSALPSAHASPHLSPDE